jgi:hypothetical protein
MLCLKGNLCTQSKRPRWHNRDHLFRLIGRTGAGMVFHIRMEGEDVFEGTVDKYLKLSANDGHIVIVPCTAWSQLNRLRR